MFKFLKLVKDTDKQIKSNNQEAQQHAELSWEEFLVEWSARQSRAAIGVKKLCNPAIENELAVAENNIGCSLPAEIRAFYLLSNGITDNDAESQKYVLEAKSLKLCADWDFSLSRSLDDRWVKEFKEEGELRALRIFGLDYLKLIADQEELTIPYEDVDEFVPLNEPNEDMTTLLVARPHKKLSVGTILLVENGVGTKYNTFQLYLANDLTTLSIGMS